MSTEDSLPMIQALYEGNAPNFEYVLTGNLGTVVVRSNKALTQKQIQLVKDTLSTRGHVR